MGAVGTHAPILTGVIKTTDDGSCLEARLGVSRFGRILPAFVLWSASLMVHDDESIILAFVKTILEARQAEELPES